MAIGIVAFAIESLEDIGGETAIDEKSLFLQACIAGFAQGASVSLNLILQAQYMKASAVLKQDIELLARFHEILIDQVRRNTPNIAFAPEGSGPIYGKLNETAHPSCLQAVGDVLATLDGALAVIPIRKDRIEYVLVYWHVWICAGFAEAAVQLLNVVASHAPENPEKSRILNNCNLGLEYLVRLGESISKTQIDGVLR